MKSYDTSFLKRLQQREEAAFTILYNDTVDIFFRYLKVTYFLDNAEIDDILSTYYVKLRENLKRLDVKTGLSSWMRTIFKNLVKDNFKAHSSIHFSQMRAWRDDDAEGYEDTLGWKDDVEQTLSTNREYDAIIAAIEKLEWDYKEVIYMKFVEEYSYEEIAKILKSSEQTIRQKVSRWLKKLKSLLP